MNPEEEGLIPPKPSVKAPANFTSPDELYKELEDSVRKYHPSDDLSLIRKAYEVALNSHGDQRRRSGEPYIIHPLCVAIILAELELDKESIAAGLLHDVLEDTPMTLKELIGLFGEEIAFLVDGVTKLTQINWDMDKIEIQAENLRKMFLAMAKDIRVIMVKLADRLHNMRTGQFWKPETQKQKAKETLEIYSPLASRLGISKIKTELDDLSLMYLHPDVYKELTEKIYSTQDARERFIDEIKSEVAVKLEEAEIKAEISGRVKHLFSIYKKMVNQDKTLDQIYDIFAVRIIVDTVKDCYAALGVIHEMYHPITVRFKDYIAMPKPNMYQSLHTTLIAKNGQPFEIQIRTFEMHRTAEYGIAAHWKYKERGSGDTTVRDEEAKLSWLRQILEWQKDVSDNKEFISMVKNDLDLFSDNVYCFTPQGDVKNLPAGSTPIDFAYSIHSAVGNRMKQAAVNGKMVPLDYKIQNGDRIEIFTSQNVKGPSRDWLNIAKSTQAKNKINQWFKTEFKEENIIRGKDMLNRYCKAKEIILSNLLKPEFMEKVIRKYGFKDWDAVNAAVGHGGLKEGQVINKLLEEYQKKQRKEMTDKQLLTQMTEMKQKPSVAVQPHKKGSKSGIIVKGIDDVAVRFSKCCNPVPGDEIVGFITRGRGVSIHRTDCVNMLHLSEIERQRLIDAEWQDSTADGQGGLYKAELNVYVHDGVGVLIQIAQVFSERDINVTAMSSRSGKNNTATINISFDIGGKYALNKIIDKLRSLDCVYDIARTTG